MLGILCGLQAEARIAEKIPGAKIACAAAVPLKARSLAHDLVRQGATRLMSFGVAGALDIALPVGALIVGRNIVAENGRWSCDAAWGADLRRALPDALPGDVWGSETLVPTAAEKIALHTNTGCSIVDMESQCAAEAAQAAGVPLAVVRVVCDEANHNVPMLVMAAINSDGSTNYAKVLSGLLRAPLQTFDLIKVGKCMAKALGVLDGVAKIMEDQRGKSCL